MFELRFPDIPSREIDHSHLEDMPGWFAKLKIDGWRCLVHRKDGVFSYWSKALKPLAVPDSVRIPFEEYVISEKCPGNFIIDCELTGNRRAGDAEGIFVLDVLAWQSPEGDVMAGAIAAFRGAFIRCRLPQYAVPSADSDFRTFFDSHKTNPLAEGIVLFRYDGKYAGGKYACVKHTGIIKCKWRAGQAGTTLKY